MVLPSLLFSHHVTLAQLTGGRQVSSLELKSELKIISLSHVSKQGKTATSANAKAQGIFPKRRLQPSSQYVSACQDKGNLFR